MGIRGVRVFLGGERGILGVRGIGWDDCDFENFVMSGYIVFGSIL